MGSAQSAQEFFESQALATPSNNQFNVFEREAFACQPVPYNRRDFYKIALLFGTSRLLYADQGVAIDRPALVFSNPMVPYSWEGISPDQGGYFCLFTEDFLKAKDRDLVLQDSPLFKIGAVLIRLSEMEVPPLNFPAGSDAVAMASQTAERFRLEVEQNKELSASTDAQSTDQ
jgi:hypothetical protein